MKIIYAILITFAVVSCSSERKAQYHVRKALKHGAKLTQDSDTIRITTIDSFPVIRHDSIVWEKFIAYRDTVIHYRNIWVPKTRWQTRLEYRYKTKVERIRGKTIYKTAKAEQVVKYRTLWWPFWLGLAIPYILKLAWGAVLSKLNR